MGAQMRSRRGPIKIGIHGHDGARLNSFGWHIKSRVRRNVSRVTTIACLVPDFYREGVGDLSFLKHRVCNDFVTRPLSSDMTFFSVVAASEALDPENDLSTMTKPSHVWAWSQDGFDICLLLHGESATNKC